MPKNELVDKQEDSQEIKLKYCQLQIESKTFEAFGHFEVEEHDDTSDDLSFLLGWWGRSDNAIY